MSLRRSMLMAIASQYKWLPYSMEYIYHNLIPTELPTFNIWNEEWEVGGLVAGSLNSKDFIKVLPNTSYYYKTGNIASGNAEIYYYDNNKNLITTEYGGQSAKTTPSNCYYIKFRMGSAYGTTYNHNICINLSNPARNGTYLPYQPRHVKDKGRLGIVSGNSEVENQSIKLPSIENGWAWTVPPSSITDGVITWQATASEQYVRTNTSSLIAGHKYLCLSMFKFSTYMANFSVFLQTTTQRFFTLQNNTNWQLLSKLFEATSSDASSNATLRFYQNTETTYYSVQIKDCCLIDLTKRYPFDTPTSINDSRVQNIIRQGYQGHNTGEIKNSIVGEIESEGFNIWNEETEVGSINLTTGANESGTRLRCKDYIKVLPNTDYACNNISSGNPVEVVCFYDNNKNYLGRYDDTPINFTTPSNCYYIRFRLDATYGTTYNHNICINRSSSLNGTYRPFKPSQYLPSEYQEVEYLESHGTEYIDTGFVPSSTTKITLKHQFTNSSSASGSDIPAFGVFKDSSTRFNVCLYNANYYLQVGIGSGYYNAFTGSSEQIKLYEYELNGSGSFVINGTSYSTGASLSTNTLSFWLFNCNDNGVSTFTNCKAKLYSCQIYDNGTLVRNFIPCYRKSDNVAGLYDLVNCVFYTNQGTGTFAIGGNVNNNTIVRLPAPLELASAGNSHNTFEITRENYVFTRNVFENSFNDLTWITVSNNRYASTALTSTIKAPSSNSNKAQLICSKFENATNENVYDNIKENIVACANNGVIGVYVSSTYFANHDVSQFLSDYGTTRINYQLATPQVINIPRKHLGCVKLKDLSWTYSNGFLKTSSLGNDIVGGATSSDLPNAFCHDYMVASWSSSSDRCIYVAPQNNTTETNRLQIKDARFTNATDFVNSLSDTDILWYETASETQDFIDELSLETGGALNGNLFSWNKNQLVPNGNFVSGVNWNTRDSTFTILYNTATFTATAQKGYLLNMSLPRQHQHKYLGLAKVKLTTYDANIYIRMYVGNVNSNHSLQNTTNWQQVAIFDTALETANDSNIGLYDARSSGWDSIQIKEVNLIDLTKGFGAGNEPTDINDYRIQKIIELGYIPQDLVGTHTMETCETLPNVEMRLKCK